MRQYKRQSRANAAAILCRALLCTTGLAILQPPCAAGAETRLVVAGECGIALQMPVPFSIEQGEPDFLITMAELGLSLRGVQVDNPDAPAGGLPAEMIAPYLIEKAEKREIGGFSGSVFSLSVKENSGEGQGAQCFSFSAHGRAMALLAEWNGEEGRHAWIRLLGSLQAAPDRDRGLWMRDITAAQAWEERQVLLFLRDLRQARTCYRKTEYVKAAAICQKRLASLDNRTLWTPRLTAIADEMRTMQKKAARWVLFKEDIGDFLESQNAPPGLGITTEQLAEAFDARRNDGATDAEQAPVLRLQAGESICTARVQDGKIVAIHLTLPMPPDNLPVIVANLRRAVHVMHALWPDRQDHLEWLSNAVAKAHRSLQAGDARTIGPHTMRLRWFAEVSVLALTAGTEAPPDTPESLPAATTE